MKTWNETIDYSFEDKLTNEVFTEHTLFFDIETTGFSPKYSQLYLIGCAKRTGNQVILSQFFADTKEEECDILTLFLEELSHCETIITFNGSGFDIPYLTAKCETFGLSHSFGEKNCLDLFKTAASMKPVLRLPDYKQKTLESFLSLPRNDIFNGGELIDIYRDYQKSKASDALSVLKQHNYEDVLGMTGLLPILSYRRLFDGNFSVVSVESHLFLDNNGIAQKELLLTLETVFPIPKRVSCRGDFFYLIADKTVTRLSVRLFDGALKFFLPHPEEYYYLPLEDTAIHKSVAAYVDKTHRQKATLSTCYTKKDAIFVPQYGTQTAPSFKKNYKDKISYFELTSEFLESMQQLFAYVNHIFRHLLPENTKSQTTD